MNIQDIENMTAAELKGKGEAVRECVDGLSSDVIGTRYLMTLIDAKNRDEKLAEQGKTITMLQGADEWKATRISELEKRIDTYNKNDVSLAQQLTEMKASHKAEIAATRESHDKAAVNLKSDYDQKLESWSTQFDTVTAKLNEQQQRGDRLKGQAVKNQSALSKAASILNDAISFNQIDTADAGS